MEIRPGARPVTRMAVALVAVAMAIIEGCAGPRPARPAHFGSIPPPGQMESPGYAAILGPVSGRGSKTFTISAPPGIAVWIACIGEGRTWMGSPVEMAAVCGNGTAYASGLTQPTNFRRGQQLTVRITAPKTVRWRFRIDGAHW